MTTLLQKLSKSPPFFLICGLNVLENADATLRAARTIFEVKEKLRLECVFKASFDKANRSNVDGFRGVGIEEGMKQLDRVRKEFGFDVVTDVHERQQLDIVRNHVQMIQIPAFLCRQTDLIVEAARTGLPLLLKKGQFASADVMIAARDKALSQVNNAGVILCERGTSVGPDSLVVDFRNLVWMRSENNLVVLDATHAAQRPAARTREGKGSDGDIFAVWSLARAGVAVGVNGLFLEVHESPTNAPVDSKVQIPLDELFSFVSEMVNIARASSGRG